MPSTSMVQDEFFPGANESAIDWPKQTTLVPFLNQSAWSMPTLNYPFPPVASQQTQTRGSPWPHYQQVQYTLYGQSASQSATLNSHPLQRGTWGGGGGGGGVLNTATPQTNKQKKLTNTASPREKSTKHRHHNRYF